MSKQESRHLGGKSWVRWSIGIAIVLIVCIATSWLLIARATSDNAKIDNSKYQVVFLNNGQAYVGKLKNVTGEWLYIESPYVAQDVKPEEGEVGIVTTTLTKVQDQLYGPDDTIAIRAGEVSFWQNLRDDGKAVQAIKNKQQQ